MPNAPESLAEPVPAAAVRVRYPPIIWLSILCLDAPIVALSWQWIFAWTFGARLSVALRALLFLTNPKRQRTAAIQDASRIPNPCLWTDAPYVLATYITEELGASAFGSFLFGFLRSG